MATKKPKAEKKEEWRPVPRYEGLYEISSFGQVRSLPRETACGILGGAMLKASVAANGYLRVTLSRAGKAARFSLHRLVLAAFVGPCPAGQECRHFDGVRSNCRLLNLSWGTRAQNAADRVAHGTHVDNRGERHGMAQLTDAAAREIFRLRDEGVPIANVAARFSISQATVSRIANGKGWTHINQGASS